MSDHMKTLLRHRHQLNWKEADLLFDIANAYSKSTLELEKMFADLAKLTESLPNAIHESLEWIIELRERHPDGSENKFVIDLNSAFYFMQSDETAYNYVKDILEAAQGKKPLSSVPRSNSFSDSPDWYSEMYSNKSPDLIFEYDVEAALKEDEDIDTIPF